MPPSLDPRRHHRPRRRAHRLVLPQVRSRRSISPPPSSIPRWSSSPASISASGRRRISPSRSQDGRVWLTQERQGLRRHPDRRLSRPLRALPPAHQRVLPAGGRASEAGRRRRAERRADDHALRQRGRHHQVRLRRTSSSCDGDGNIVILAYNGPEKDEATLQRQAAERTGAIPLALPARRHPRPALHAAMERQDRSRSPTTSPRSNI